MHALHLHVYIHNVMILLFNVFMQITSSKGYKENAMKIPGSIFTSEEDETRYMYIQSVCVCVCVCVCVFVGSCLATKVFIG